MSLPKREFDSDTLRSLASVVMEGRATARQQQQLTQLLRDNEDARDEYLAYVDMHAMLAAELSIARRVPEAAGPTNMRSSSRRKRRWIQAISAVGMAACLLIALLFIATPGSDVTQGAPFASVTLVSNADGQLEAGDRLGAESIRIPVGFARLHFDDGVDVTLEGPAEFELIELGRARLTSGLLTATVPDGAEGFHVETPIADIVDLGTSFGVDLREVGFSRVSVFDGEVEVALSEADQKHLLAEGESVRIGADQEIEKVEFDPDPFEKVWPYSSGIAGSSEAFRFVPPWPKRLRFVESDSNIFVATEGYSVELSEPLRVNISEPGMYERVDDLTPSELPQGKRVRSYILHYAPAVKRGPRNAKRVTGSITFDRPIAGLIVRHEELVASMRRFTRRGAGEDQHRRQLDLSGDSRGDRVTVSEDRKTVSLDLISPGRSTDLVRVIVDGTRRVRVPRRRRR